MIDYIINAFTRQNNKTNLEVNNLNVDCITSTNNNFELDSDGNLSVKSITAEQGGSGGSVDVLNSVYPVGAIYMSVSSTNPSVIFGGTWEQIQDKFLLACGSSYLNGQTGGESTHTLTVDEMPNHSHVLGRPFYKFSELTYGLFGDVFKGELFQDASQTTSSTGGNQPHNNMPPYLAVYMWKRVS